MGLDPSEAEDHVCPEGAPAWLATMGDLMSNLLVFFVLMLSFANTDKQIFLETIESIQAAFGTTAVGGSGSLGDPSAFEPAAGAAPGGGESRPDRKAQWTAMDQRIMQKVQQAIAKERLSRVVEADMSERGVVVRVKGHALFQPGSDQLLPISFVFLDELIRVAEESAHALSIEGHSDDSDLDVARFPTSWHLSAARSLAVLQYILDSGRVDRSRVAVSGFGSTRPLVPSDSPENRAANRRVEFVFEREPAPDPATGAAPRAPGTTAQAGTRRE